MRYDLDEITIVGNNLIINGVAEKDDGDFICEVETKENFNGNVTRTTSFAERKK